MLVLGIDLGGTKINFGLVKIQKESFEILKQNTIASPKEKKEFICVVQKNIQRIITPDTKKIGLAQAGLIQQSTKINLFSPNLKVLENFNLAQILEKEFNLSVSTDNDANAFTLAEATFGAGRGKDRVVGITLGTGIGGGIVMNNEIYHGACSSAAEFGHTIIDYNGRKCGCGKQGCMEAYASATAIIKEYENRAGFRRDTYALEEEAKSNLEPAKSIFSEASNYLGIGLANIINILE
ncbi:MAG: ROK family protein, partial [bacterium]|nr:ROK family protein [bacterium]